MDYKCIFGNLQALFAAARTERTTAGTRFRLMGLAADVAEVAEVLEREVLERVRHEAVLDVDADLDFEALSAEVLTWEIEEEDPLPAPPSGGEPRFAREGPREGSGEQVGQVNEVAGQVNEQAARVNEQVGQVNEAAAQVNEALGVLSGVLADIAEQMGRRHSEEEYVRLYEAEQRRYLNSGTARRARQTFEEWKDITGEPTLEDIEDYRLEKVLHLFEDGILDERVEHIQRAKRYPGELDFEQLDSGLKLTKTVYHHYAALRKLVDWKDGALVVNPARVGQHFYASRHEVNAKRNRSLLLKYMHKVALVQEERSRLAADEANTQKCPDSLRTAEAEVLWQKAQTKGWVDDQRQPTGLSRTDAALLAARMAEVLGIEGWKPFEQLWNRLNIRQDYSKAMGKQGATEFIDELKRALR